MLAIGAQWLVTSGCRACEELELGGGTGRSSTRWGHHEASFYLFGRKTGFLTFLATEQGTRLHMPMSILLAPGNSKPSPLGSEVLGVSEGECDADLP